MMKRVLAVCAAVGLATLSYVSAAQAGSKITDYIDTKATTIKGTIETNSSGNVDPFVVQIYAGGTGTECLVVMDTAPKNFDATATLVAPDGTVWFDDDSNGNLRPRIKAITSSRGWFVLTISTYAGFAGTRDITLSYGRYPASSANCSGATSPLNFATAATKAPVSE